MLNLTTCPATAAPVPSLTTATAVTGADVVTMVFDRVNASDGVPVTGLPADDAVNPAVAITCVPATVACATASAAPLVVAVAGDSLTKTMPLMSVSAEGGLKVPSGSMLENLTT